LPRSAETVEDFLVELLSRRLGRPAEGFDVKEPFVNLGISSVQVVELTGELEKWLQRPLRPTFFYNYPTIAALAEHLTSEGAANGRQASGNRELPALEVPRECPTLSQEEGDLVSNEVARLQR
jgi:acyl carrier protein